MGETTGAIKYIGRDTVEGLAIPFKTARPSGLDLTGEYFDAETDLCIDWFGKGGRPFLYDHGLDGAMKTDRIGRQVDYDTRDEGIWAASQIDMNARYRKAVDELIEREALGYSSGAMQHLATKDATTGRIKRWPWVELSGTPIPAEPLTLGIHYVKSAHGALLALEGEGVSVPDPLKAAIAALDNWAETRDAAPAAVTYADEYDRLLVASSAFVDRTADLADIRLKSGRVLSTANRQRLSELRDRIAAASEHASGVIADLDDLLTVTDPGASKRLWDAVFEALTSEAAGLGVDVTT